MARPYTRRQRTPHIDPQPVQQTPNPDLNAMLSHVAQNLLAGEGGATDTTHTESEQVSVASRTDIRPPMRPEMRDEDPRARAARRAAELREHAGDQLAGNDKFYIDPKLVPPGWSYEWKRRTVYGAEDPSYTVNLARQGWESVDVSRHPELMPQGFKGAIEMDGMMLMERPAEITDDAKKRDYRNAVGQVRGNEERLQIAPSGQFDRDNKGNPMAKVSSTYEHMAIPD